METRLRKRKTADSPGWLRGGLYRFYCHWQGTVLQSAFLQTIAMIFQKLEVVHFIGLGKKSRPTQKNNACPI
jgi:hypothetical protein